MNEASISSTEFGEALLTQVPGMRAFAMSLCGNIDRADDLVQDALVRAWAARDSFAAGTNMRAWLFTILRNSYFGELRKRRREVEDPDNVLALALSTPGEQESRMEFAEFKEALSRLPPDQREVLILVGASGFSYEETAEIVGVAIGTIKSRLNRARDKLSRMLSIEPAQSADRKPDAIAASSSERV